MNPKLFLLIFFMIFITMLFSVGCISTNEGFQEESNTRLTAPPEPTKIFVTLTATLDTSEVTKTKEFVPTVTPAVTITPSIAPASTTTPTHTPLPTLVPEEAEKLIMELINGTDDCQLPCWMGIIPGQTTWYDIEPTLQAIGADIYLSSERTNPEIQIPVSKEVHPRGYLDYWLTINDSKLTISEINMRRLGSSSNYDLPQALEMYGTPSEVWLNTYGYSRERDIPFRLILVFGEHNFMITYGDNAYDNTNDGSGVIRGCIIPASKNDNKGIPSAFSWDPQLNYSFSDLSGRLDLGLKDQKYFALEEATGMSVTEFYEMFVGTSDPVCLETPTELWP